MDNNVQIKFGADVAGAIAGIQQVGGTMTGLAAKTGIATSAFAALKASVMSAIAPLLILGSLGKAFSVVETMAANRETMVNFARNVGMTTATIRTATREITLLGGNTEALQPSMMKFVRALGQAENGNRNLGFSMQQLGIDMHATVDQQFAQAVAGFQRLQNGAQKTALEFQLFGRGGVGTMGPLLSLNRAQVAELGATMDRVATGPLPNLEHSLVSLAQQNQELKVAQSSVTAVMADALAPAMASVTHVMTGMVEGFVQSYREGGSAKHMLEGIATAMKTIATAVMVVTAALGIAMAWVDGFVRATADGLKRIDDMVHGRLRDAQQDAIRQQHDWADAMHGSAEATIAAARALDSLWSSASGDNGMQDQNAEAIAQARQVAAEALHLQMARYALEQQAAQDNFDQVIAIENRKLAAIREFYGEDSKEYLDALRARNAMQDAHNTQMLAQAQKHVADLAKIEADHVHAQANIEARAFDTREAQLQEDVANFRITEQQKADAERVLMADRIAAEQAAADRVFQIELQSMRDRLAMDGLTPQQKTNLNDQIYALQQAHEDRMNELHSSGTQRQAQVDRKAANLQRDTWRQTWMSMESTFSQTIQGLIERTTSWQDAFLKIQNMLIDKIVEWAVKWVMTHLWAEHAVTGAAAAGAATRTAIGATATTVGLAQSGALALGDIANSAARAAAGAYAAIASIPFVGPVLAPAAAVAAMAAVLALGKSLVSARGGMGSVPYDGMLAQLHKDEMVLPASIASPLRSQLASGGGVSGNGGGAMQSGDTHNHFNINAMDAKSFAAYLKQNSGALTKALVGESRGFASITAGYAGARA